MILKLGVGLDCLLLSVRRLFLIQCSMSDWMGLGWDEGEHSCVAGGGRAVGWMGGGVSGSGVQCS